MNKKTSKAMKDWNKKTLKATKDWIDYANRVGIKFKPWNIPNPNRKWYQFRKPKMIPNPEFWKEPVEPKSVDTIIKKTEG